MLKTVVCIATVRRYSSFSPSGLTADVASSNTAYLGWWKKSRAKPVGSEVRSSALSGDVSISSYEGWLRSSSLPGHDFA